VVGLSMQKRGYPDLDNPFTTTVSLAYHVTFRSECHLVGTWLDKKFAICENIPYGDVFPQKVHHMATYPRCCGLKMCM
jgi:hypothetical protein